MIGESDQFYPVVHDNTTPVTPSTDPDYYYQTDIADKAMTSPTIVSIQVSWSLRQGQRA